MLAPWLWVLLAPSAAFLGAPTTALWSRRPKPLSPGHARVTSPQELPARFAAAASAEGGDEVAAIHADADAIFSVVDMNGDDVITFDELTAHLLDCGYSEDAVGAIFAALDEDLSGTLSRDELRAGLVRHGSLRDARGLGGDYYRSPADVRDDADAVFAMIDVDGDGSITNAELREHLRERGYADAAVDKIFATLDVNFDGGLSQEELRAAFARYVRATAALLSAASGMKLSPPRSAPPPPRYSALRFATGGEQVTTDDEELDAPPL